ncbi:MAG: sugar phosphate isomerase/epimerase family protein [Saprospiraceae bacterium]
MKKNRRQFIQTAGTVTAGALILPHWACGNSEKPATMEEQPTVTTAKPKGDIDQFGIQLYTLRDVITEDPKVTLKALSDYGYRQIESYEGPQGIFWNMKNTEFQKYLADLGMNMVSAHANVFENVEEKAAQIAEIGGSYLICPYIGPGKSAEEWKKTVDTFNECGEVCAKNGIKFAYHNHDYSFEEEIDGMKIQDYLMQNTDEGKVNYEIDMYWVVEGGASNIEYLKKYKERFQLCHVKDRSKNAAQIEGNASCTLGTGTIDYATILKVAEEVGMEYYIMEQERYDNTTPMKCAEDGAKFLQQLKFA